MVIVLKPHSTMMGTADGVECERQQVNKVRLYRSSSSCVHLFCSLLSLGLSLSCPSFTDITYSSARFI